MDEVMTLHESRARVPIFVMLVELDKETKEYKPSFEKSESKQAILESNLWIIGGQHTIEAMREVMNDPHFANCADIKTYYNIHKIVVVWNIGYPPLSTQYH